MGMMVRLINREHVLYALAVVILVAVAFRPCLNAQFLTWDDDEAILKNPDVQTLDPQHVKNMFGRTIMGIYAPLTTLTFAMEQHWFGQDPFVYHLDNLLLHVINVLLVLGLAVRLGLSRRAAFGAALLFGIHPMHVESVAWVTERKDVLYAMFYLMSMHWYWTYLQERSRRCYGLAVVCGLLSVLAKPMALSLPLVLWLMDWYARRPLRLSAAVDKIPFFIYTIPIVAISYCANVRHFNGNIGQAVLTWVWTLVFYPWKFLCPLDLEPTYTLPRPIGIFEGPYVAAFFFFVLLGAAVVRYRRHRLWMFAVGQFLLSIFFVLGLNYDIYVNIVADRFMYLPSLGFCLLMGCAADRVLQRSRSMAAGLRAAAVSAVIIAAVLLGWKTYQQCGVWQDSIRFWTYVIEHHPKYYYAYNNRGFEFYKIGRDDLALRDYDRAIAIYVGCAKAYYNRGLVYERRGEAGKAAKDFQTARRFGFDDGL